MSTYEITATQQPTSQRRSRRPFEVETIGIGVGQFAALAAAVFALTFALSGCSGDDTTAAATGQDAGVWSLFDGGAGDLGDSSSAKDAATADSVQLGDVSSSDGTTPDVADTTAALDASAGTCPGAPGCSCAAAPDCNDGLCVDTPLGRRCAQPCGAGCKEAGFACLKLIGSGGKSVDACAPGWGRLCQPCGASKDCEAAGIVDALCVDHGVAGLFCGAACVKNDDCPAGYGCQVANSTEGGKAKQCVRLPAAGSKEPFGVCSCWPASKADGLSSKCYANQTDLDGKVVGKCPGQRICGQTGLGKCILTAAKAEVCDGVDNDCNGSVDENAAGCAADEACVKGKCSKTCSAVNGNWSGWVWGACSAVCGGGTRTATRSCTAPPPACGGLVCPGAASKSEACNAQPCSAGSLAKGTTIYSEGGKKISGTVPSGVTSATVYVWGAGGGGCYPGHGGGGAFVKVTVPVKTGDTLDFRVASGGGKMGGGGGASYLSKNGVQIAIAAGGGGAGCDGCSGCSGAATIGAGGGGGAIGAAGQNGAANNKYNTNSGGGGGGSATQGGAGGAQTNASAYTGCKAKGSAGSKDTGGGCAGGHLCKVGPYATAQSGSASCIGNGSGGGGGAGYFGGGSGAAMYTYSGGGGGGGSSWAQPANATSEAGVLQVPGGVSAAVYGANAGRGGVGKPKNGTTGKPEAGMSGRIVLVL